MTTGLIGSITAVWTELSSWLVETLGDLVSVFYSAENGLSFLGILAVAALGMSVIFLVMSIIQGFLHFRG